MFINAENHGMCFHAVNTETVSMVYVNMFCTEVAWLMHGSITKMATYPWVFLALKKHLSSSLEPSQPTYLAGISLELHLVAAWPYKPYRTGCDPMRPPPPPPRGPVQSMSARSVHDIRMSVPSVTTALVSFTLVVQITSVFWIRRKSV